MIPRYIFQVYVLFASADISVGQPYNSLPRNTHMEAHQVDTRPQGHITRGRILDTHGEASHHMQPQLPPPGFPTLETYQPQNADINVHGAPRESVRRTSGVNQQGGRYNEQASHVEMLSRGQKDQYQQSEPSNRRASLSRPANQPLQILRPVLNVKKPSLVASETSLYNETSQQMSATKRQRMNPQAVRNQQAAPHQQQQRPQQQQQLHSPYIPRYSHTDTVTPAEQNRIHQIPQLEPTEHTLGTIPRSHRLSGQQQQTFTKQLDPKQLHVGQSSIPLQQRPQDIPGQYHVDPRQMQLQTQTQQVHGRLDRHEIIQQRLSQQQLQQPNKVPLQPVRAGPNTPIEPQSLQSRPVSDHVHLQQQRQPLQQMHVQESHTRYTPSQPDHSHQGQHNHALGHEFVHSKLLHNHEQGRVQHIHPQLTPVQSNRVPPVSLIQQGRSEHIPAQQSHLVHGSVRQQHQEPPAQNQQQPPQPQRQQQQSHGQQGLGQQITRNKIVIQDTVVAKDYQAGTGAAASQQQYQNQGLPVLPHEKHAHVQNYRYASKGCVGMATLRQASNIIHCQHACKIVILSVAYGTNLECPTEITSPVDGLCCGWNDGSDCVTVFGQTAQVTKQIQWGCQQDSSCALRVDRQMMYGPPSHCTQPGYNTFRQIDYACQCTPAVPIDPSPAVPASSPTPFPPTVAHSLRPNTITTGADTTSSKRLRDESTVIPATPRFNLPAPTNGTVQTDTSWHGVLDEIQSPEGATASDELGVIVGVAVGVVCAIVLLSIIIVLAVRKRHRDRVEKAEDDWSLGGPDYASIDECRMDGSVSGAEPYYSTPPSPRSNAHYTSHDPDDSTREPGPAPTSHELQRQKIALKPAAAAAKLRAGFEVINLAIAAHVDKTHHGYYSPTAVRVAPHPDVVQTGTSEYGGLYRQTAQRPPTARRAETYDHLNHGRYVPATCNVEGPSESYNEATATGRWQPKIATKQDSDC